MCAGICCRIPFKPNNICNNGMHIICFNNIAPLLSPRAEGEGGREINAQIKEDGETQMTK